MIQEDSTVDDREITTRLIELDHSTQATIESIRRNIRDADSDKKRTEWEGALSHVMAQRWMIQDCLRTLIGFPNDDNVDLWLEFVERTGMVGMESIIQRVLDARTPPADDDPDLTMRRIENENVRVQEFAKSVREGVLNDDV